MSYLGSIISSINGQTESAMPSGSASRPKPRPNDAIKGSTIQSTRPISPLKRKHDDSSDGPSKRAVKPTGDSAVMESGARPSSSNGPGSRPTTASSNKASKMTSTSAVQSTASSSAASKPSSQNASSTNYVAPRKGSYKDMMARARAAQATQVQAPVAGQIKHSSAVSKKKLERREAREQARQATKHGKDTKLSPVPLRPASTGKGAQNTKHAKADSTEAAAKKKKERAPLEYKGTMRGAATNHAARSARAKPATTAVKNKQSRGGPSDSESEIDDPELGKRYTYADYSDEDEDDAYDSERSSDMEGGGYDALEAEEELSLRVAKKEDAEALKEEEAHRRAKMERNKKLQQLAAKAKPRF